MNQRTSPDLFHSPSETAAPWWRTAVIYQVYPRSWADFDGDGVGDLPGITARLPYLADLGVDALWISPFYVSPMADAGYDVADYRDIDPIFGTLADADALLERAHGLGLKVIVDLVPNHTSRAHPWFQAALAAGPGSPERQRYIFRDGSGELGNEPPNNWESVFTGSAWTQAEVGTAERPGQWYLNLFDSGQPDLNWDHPQVREEFRSILRFWLDRGVDGFRVDVAHGLIKAEGLPDWDEPASQGPQAPPTCAAPMWDQDGVHAIYRDWRNVCDEYNPPASPEHDPNADRILVAEAWVEPLERVVRYVRPDEMHQAFNFHFLQTPWRAADLRSSITESLQLSDTVGAPTTWVLSNHDIARHATWLGLPTDLPRPRGLRAQDPQPDEALGLRRARAATTLMLALPGSAYLYQGEELGLPDHTTLPDEARQDPTWHRSGGTETGRDGCRIPMPWQGQAPAGGFNDTGRTWLPQPDSYPALAVDQQQGVDGSTLELYRRLLSMRQERAMSVGGFGWLPSDEDVLHALNVAPDGRRTAVIVNFSDSPVALPEGEVLLSSAELVQGALPSDSAAWLAVQNEA
ncbi:glycoside hydrolase family 13 protein [Gephyromycinifex aptenodytis]|uniref:glycoside hydrolase family 13 protein n=1 Tax=Gephyromycinifex aptenodytis TaxID=2716227 RepID=UPI001D01CD01|nr:glycoside hydrolase family 13 protein [Gephyromycinifex aptenodytis]